MSTQPQRTIPILLGIALLLAVPCSASPRHKHFFQSGKWWIGEAVILASVAADTHSTRYALDRGGSEMNAFLGNHPSNGDLVGFGLAAAGYWTFFHALEWNLSHDDPKLGWRIVGATAIPIAASAIHVSAAIQNYQVKSAAEREGLVHPDH